MSVMRHLSKITPQVRLLILAMRATGTIVSGYPVARYFSPSVDDPDGVWDFYCGFESAQVWTFYLVMQRLGFVPMYGDEETSYLRIVLVNGGMIAEPFNRIVMHRKTSGRDVIVRLNCCRLVSPEVAVLSDPLSTTRCFISWYGLCSSYYHLTECGLAYVDEWAEGWQSDLTCADEPSVVTGIKGFWSCGEFRGQSPMRIHSRCVREMYGNEGYRMYNSDSDVTVNCVHRHIMDKYSITILKPMSRSEEASDGGHYRFRVSLLSMSWLDMDGRVSMHSATISNGDIKSTRTTSALKLILSRMPDAMIASNLLMDKGGKSRWIKYHRYTSNPVICEIIYEAEYSRGLCDKRTDVYEYDSDESGSDESGSDE